MRTFLGHSRSKVACTAIILSTLTACGGSDSSDTAPTLTITNGTISDVSGVAGSNGTSIIANATVDGKQLTLQQIQISVLSSDSPLSLNEEGSVVVAPMTSAGTYSLEYQICLVDEPSVCENGTVNVEVSAAEFNLADDLINDINGGFANENIINILANDQLNAQSVNADDVTVTVTEKNAELSVQDGQVSVSANTVAGEYALTYQVCENLNPENCASANATFNVTKGQFMGGVAGIGYESDSANGVTDSDGGFIYKQGDSIKFYIGATNVGEQVLATANMSPLDLIKDSKVPVEPNDVNSFLDNTYDFDLNPGINELVNALTLIYSVDKDKDNSNGVVIDENLHAFWVSTTLNLKQTNYSFDRDKGFNVALYKAFDQNLIANASVTPYFHALDTFAAQQGVTPQVYGVKQEAYLSEPEVFDEVYNISVSADKSTVTWDYLETDGEGNVLPEIAYQDKYFYDQHANYMGMEYYEEGEKTSSDTYIYDIHGNKVRYDYSSVYGEISSRWYEYNNIGLETSFNEDNDGDEVSDEAEFNQYDENGNEISYQRDDDGDGKIDYKRITEYTNNLKVKQSNYNDTSAYEGAENDVDHITYYYYNEAGLRIRQETDNDVDGNIDYLTEWDYNEAGQVIEHRTDNNLANEIFEYRSVTTYENGLLISNFTDSDGDGSDDRGKIHEYDERGNLIHKIYYNSGFDKPLYENFYRYDDNNNLVEYLNDNNGDGVIEYTYLYTFDENSNLISYLNYKGENQEGEFRFGYQYEYLLTDFTTAYLLEN